MNLIVPLCSDYVNNDTGFMPTGFSDSRMDMVLNHQSSGLYEPPSMVSSMGAAQRTTLKESSLIENRSIDFHTTVRSSLPTTNRPTRLNDVEAPPMQRPARRSDGVHEMKFEMPVERPQSLIDWQLLREIRPTIICASVQQ